MSIVNAAKLFSSELCGYLAESHVTPDTARASYALSYRPLQQLDLDVLLMLRIIALSLERG